MKRTAILPACSLLLLALAGCVPQAHEPGAGAPSEVPSASGSPTAATPTATPTPDPGATPIGFGCAEFVSAQAMYDYNSIFSAVDTGPDAGTAAAEAVENGGIACRWLNTSSGTTIDFSVAMPSAPSLEAREAALRGSEAATFDGFFAGSTAQAFSGGYWIAVTSGEFLTDADAAPLIAIAIDGLP